MKVRIYAADEKTGPAPNYDKFYYVYGGDDYGERPVRVTARVNKGQFDLLLAGLAEGDQPLAELTLNTIVAIQVGDASSLKVPPYRDDTTVTEETLLQSRINYRKNPREPGSQVPNV